MVRSFYALLSWAFVALGGLHMVATARFYDSLTQQALWFFAGGLLMVLVAALNLLNRAYGRAAVGLRVVCIGANVVIVAFAIATGVLGEATIGQWILVLGILGPLTVLSTSRSALGAAPQPGAS